MNSFEPYDINPAPELEIASDPALEWRGSYSSEYTLPSVLVDAAERASALKIKSAGSARSQVSRSSQDSVDMNLEVEENLVKEDKERIQKLTTTLSWLHSRGELNFLIVRILGVHD